MTRAAHHPEFTVAEVRALAAKGMNRQQIADQLGLGRHAVVKICATRGIETVNGNASSISDDELCGLLRKGMSQAECARHFGTSASTIHDRVIKLHERGLLTTVSPERGRVGPAPHQPAQAVSSPLMARLSNRAWSDLYDTGGRYAELRAWGAKHGFTDTQARQWWHRIGQPVSKGHQSHSGHPDSQNKRRASGGDI